jgi:hypothetical protein
MVAARLSHGTISESSSSHSLQRGFEGGEAGDVPTRAVKPLDTLTIGGTSKNSSHRSRTTKLPPNDLALFPLRFVDVQASRVRDWH